MNKDFQDLMYKAEKQYLQASELNNLRGLTAKLNVRLATYKILRDQEIAIFQSVVDKQLVNSSENPPEIIEKVLKHWLAVMRYAAMAMLMNNPEFLQRRILEWLTPQVQAYQIETVENKFYQLLLAELKDHLSEEQFKLIQPFLHQAQVSLLGVSSNQKVST